MHLGEHLLSKLLPKLSGENRGLRKTIFAQEIRKGGAVRWKERDEVATQQIRNNLEVDERGHLPLQSSWAPW